MKTHKWLLLVIAFLAGSVPGIAQNQAGTARDQVLAKEYVSPDGRFKIRFPDAPQEFDLQVDAKTGPVISHQLVLNTDVTYSLNFTDYPINLENGDAVKATLDSARDGGLARVAKEEPRVVSESDISLDGHPGRSLRVELKGDAILRLKIVLTENRQYVLAVGTPKGDLKNAEVQKRYDKIATGFFDSFKIVPGLEADRAATWPAFTSSEGKYRVQFPGAPFRWSLPLQALSPPSTLHVTGYYSSGQYSVMYFDYAQTPAASNRAALKTFLDELNAGQIARAEQMGGKVTVVSENEIDVDGHPGRFMVAEIAGLLTYRVKTIVAKSRVYFLTIAMPNDDPKSSDPKAYETLSLKFLDSFKLTKEQ